MLRISLSWSAARSCLAAALVATATAGAGATQYTAYGTSFVRMQVDAELAAVSAAVAGESGAVDLSADAPRYRQLLEAAERSQGPYADALSEPLAALARGQRQAGDYEAALASYRRALHIVRVNDGLYAERQIPLLREMLDTFREAGDLASLDRRYDYFFRVYGMGRPPYTRLRLAAALEYLRWQREALLLELPGNPERRMLDALALNESLLDAVMSDPAAPDAWKQGLVMSQLANLYLLTDRFAPRLEEASLFAGRELVAAQPLVQSLDEQRMDNALRAAYGRGRSLLEQWQQSATELSPTQRAALTLALADWHFWNGADQRAAEGYAAVVAALREAGAGDLVEDWLGSPVELPERALLPVAVPAEGAGELVRARFDVSRRGRARSIEVEALTPEAEDSVRHFRRDLADTLFRPRWSAGEAVAAEGLVREYQLVN